MGHSRSTGSSATCRASPLDARRSTLDAREQGHARSLPAAAADARKDDASCVAGHATCMTVEHRLTRSSARAMQPTWRCVSAVPDRGLREAHEPVTPCQPIRIRNTEQSPKPAGACGYGGELRSWSPRRSARSSPSRGGQPPPDRARPAACSRGCPRRRPYPQAEPSALPRHAAAPIGCAASAATQV
jgi:hypothetical protein